MSRKINFSIGGVWGGRFIFEILIDGSTARCKAAARVHRNDKKARQIFYKAEGTLVEVSEAWLAELDALEIFSWVEYYEKPPKYPDDFIFWRLTFKDGEKIYRGHGCNAAHKNWPRFMDWLGEIFKEDSRWLNI